MNVLVVDVGGTHVKILATGQDVPREFASGAKLRAKAMVSKVKRLARKWKYDVVSIGYPGPVLCNHPVAEPHNLGRCWVGFDFEAAFGRPVKVVNDVWKHARKPRAAARTQSGRRRSRQGGGHTKGKRAWRRTKR